MIQISDYPFVWRGKGSIVDAMRLPLEGISLKLDNHGKVEKVTLWSDRSHGLQVTSTMRDVAERLEVGVLSFEVKSTSSGEEHFIHFPTKRTPSKISKLLLTESGKILESGIFLSFASEQEILIRPADFPFFLAVGASRIDLPTRLTAAEYPVDCYEMVDMFVGKAKGA